MRGEGLVVGGGGLGVRGYSKLQNLNATPYILHPKPKTLISNRHVATKPNPKPHIECGIAGPNLN
jgi:hypothetical protein